MASYTSWRCTGISWGASIPNRTLSPRIVHNGDDNFVADHDALVTMSRQNQHRWLLPLYPDDRHTTDTRSCRIVRAATAHSKWGTSKGFTRPTTPYYIQNALADRKRPIRTHLQERSNTDCLRCIGTHAWRDQGTPIWDCDLSLTRLCHDAFCAIAPTGSSIPPATVARRWLRPDTRCADPN